MPLQITGRHMTIEDTHKSYIDKKVNRLRRLCTKIDEMSVTLTPATTTDPITITVEVRNDGNAAAGASTLRLEITGAGATTHAVPALAPGATFPVEHSVGTLAAGSYTVTATADDGNTIGLSSIIVNMEKYDYSGISLALAMRIFSAVGASG